MCVWGGIQQNVHPFLFDCIYRPRLLTSGWQDVSSRGIAVGPETSMFGPETIGNETEGGGFGFCYF